MTVKVAVTGGAGFLGSHVVDHFVSAGDDVVVVDDFSEGHRDNLSGSLDALNCEVCETDLRDRKGTFSALEGVDVAVHLAAKIGGIGYFHDVPADIIAMNDAMNRNVCDAAIEHDLDRLVYASSSMVFERATDFPVREDQLPDIPSPDSAYGFQKLAGEYYCRAYHDQYGLEYSIFRPFNAVGPREPPGDEVGQAHVIPDLVKKILEEKQYPLRILGTGRQVRSFTHVTDIARGIRACAYDDAARNEHFNLGSTEAVEIRELARMIWERCDRNREIEFETGNAFDHDVEKRIPDSSKAREQLGWRPDVSLDESLAEYIGWYRTEVL